MATIRFVLFDLDGTLLDSNQSLNFTLNLLLAKDKTGRLPPIPPSQTRAYVSGGAGALLQSARPDISASELETKKQAFFDIYRKNLFHQATLFEGVAPTLETLKKNGYALGIATNKQSEFTLPLVAHLGLDEIMDVVISRDQVAVGKPDPAMIYRACQEVDIAPEACLFVGDDIRDITAGKNASTKTAIAAYGYAPASDYSSWNADYLIHSPPELLSLV